MKKKGIIMRREEIWNKTRNIKQVTTKIDCLVILQLNSAMTHLTDTLESSACKNRSTFYLNLR